MRIELSSPPTSSIHRPPSASESSTLAYSTSPYGEDDQTAWAREEQQMMMRQQDETMDSISGTLNILTQQASLMGQEIEEHNEYAFLSNYYTLSLPHSPSEKLIKMSFYHPDSWVIWIGTWTVWIINSKAQCNACASSSEILKKRGVDTVSFFSSSSCWPSC